MNLLPSLNILIRTTKSSFVVGLITLVLCSSGNTDPNFPQGYFRSPVQHPIYLSGSFGELRGNHFHSGIDIKSSTGGSGDPVVAAADGYIARIRISAGSYGNALYVNHPNGYQTVYCHLGSLDPSIAAYVKQQQYANQSFEVNLYPPADQFRLAKGQKIGTLGNSGYSFGPHLHFEIRTSADAVPVNPLLFGFPVNDHKPPSTRQVRIYRLGTDLNELGHEDWTLIDKGNYWGVPQGDTLEVGAWRIGIGLQSFDHMEGVNSKNGVYHMDLAVNEEPRYGFDMVRMPFSKTRYANAHMDYRDKVIHKSYWHRLYKLPGNKLTMYHPSDGVIKISESQPQQVNITVHDETGNKRQVRFWVKRKTVAEPTQAPFQYIQKYDQSGHYEFGGCEVDFPQGTFYTDQYLYFHSAEDRSKGYAGPVLSIQDLAVPVQQYYTLKMPLHDIPDRLQSKAFIGWCNKDEKVISYGGKPVSGGLIQAKVRACGSFAVMVDTIPPMIVPTTFSYDMTKRSKMTFKITDDRPVTGKARGLRYRGTVDGKWVLMEYDLKNDLLFHRFDKHIESGSHILHLEVSDDRGNTQTWNGSFIR